MEGRRISEQFPRTTHCQSRFQSIWWTWFVVTAAYVTFALLAFDSGQGAAQRSNQAVSYIATGLGMFAPFGIGNLLAIFAPSRDGNPLRLLAVPAAILIMWYTERCAKRWNLRCSQRLLINLAVLLVITLIVDLLVAGAWTSLYLLTRHDILGGCC